MRESEDVRNVGRLFSLHVNAHDRTNWFSSTQTPRKVSILTEIILSPIGETFIDTQGFEEDVGCSRGEDH